MRGKALVCLLVMCLLVGVVNADTLILNPKEDSTQVRSVTAENLTTIIAGTGTTTGFSRTATTAAVYFKGAVSSANYQQVRRPLFTFNLSTLSTGATINSAVLSLHGQDKSNQMGESYVIILNASPTNPETHASGDYDKFGVSMDANTIDYDSWVVGNYNNFTFGSSGLTYLTARRGMVNASFMAKYGWDYEGSGAGWGNNYQSYQSIYTLDSTNASQRPILTIDYSIGDTTPPISITGLGNTTTCNSINWTWTDSVSEDADVVQIWQNGTFLHNVSANQTYDLWEDLAESLEYTFSSHTCDLTGNCNTTWVNMTANVASCPPASITNLQNVTTCSSVNWTWSNPADTDFNYTMIYQNGTFLKNASNTTTFDLWGTLAELTGYTFSSRTVDILGNVNTTWVNQTATTGACGSAPVADFSVNDQTFCIGDTATFTDLSSNTPTGWLWDFGDGNSSVLQNPTHQYDFAGSFDVNLTANNTYGSDSEVKVGYITVSDCGVAPTAAFSGTPLCGNVPFSVTFTDASTGTGPLDYYWDFNDGNTSTLQNPSNTFSTAGAYSVFHYANSSYGLDWENKTSYITAMPVGIDCPSTVTTVEGDSDGGAIGLMYGVIGGILGSMIIIRRIKREELE